MPDLVRMLRLPNPPLLVDASVLSDVRRRTLAACLRYGVIRDEKESVQKLLARRYDLLAALIFPDVCVDRLTLACDFFVYLHWLDDKTDEDADYGKAPAELERLFTAHIAVLREGALPLSADPATLYLLDIRRRLLQLTTPRRFARLTRNVYEYLMQGALFSSYHWAAGSVPELPEYLEHRVWDSAAMCKQDLLEVCGGDEVSEPVHYSHEFLKLRRICSRILALTNDLVSYAKEKSTASSSNNLLHVLITHSNHSLHSAIQVAADAINSEIARFDVLAARLGLQAEELGLPRYIARQRTLMGANLRWSLATARYVDASSPFPELRVDPSFFVPADWRH